MKITLIGSGSWGTAIAGRAASNGNDVIMWSHSEECARGIMEQGINPRYLTHYELPKNVSATIDIVKALEGADGIIFAVPSTHIREIANQAAPYICETTPILCLTKGIESTTGLLMNEVIGDECGHPERIAALSGPNHAEEVCQGQLSAAVIAAEDNDVASFFKRILLAPQFRIYLSGDVIGVEMCGAIKNIIAIVCGIASGAGFGDNTLALIMTRGLAEISRLVHARGGEALTCMGLAGMGDLVATCTSPHSRNRSFGHAFSQGISLEQYQNQTHMVVEGAHAAKSATELAHTLGVDAPLTFALNDALWHGQSMQEVLTNLVDRVPTEEFYGIIE